MSPRRREETSPASPRPLNRGCSEGCGACRFRASLPSRAARTRTSSPGQARGVCHFRVGFECFQVDAAPFSIRRVSVLLARPAREGNQSARPRAAGKRSRTGFAGKRSGFGQGQTRFRCYGMTIKHASHVVKELSRPLFAGAVSAPQRPKIRPALATGAGVGRTAILVRRGLVAQIQLGTVPRPSVPQSSAPARSLHTRQDDRDDDSICRGC